MNNIQIDIVLRPETNIYALTDRWLHKLLGLGMNYEAIQQKV